ncbi:glutathione S-transferas-like protein [Mytilinidion resinicola]|uniref:Glutathione S-transferas-like protein n=1 Tax=Mytilinidion resinicola TaxID=574789 RepID=A0A6A6Y0X3_9PEZI|nr:glutathione S-transferas-like protein [Mytilinidion resinicola]KAF2802412.1 glutathione S-transferas-like protein [Mytilinidion resinicola]
MTSHLYGDQTPADVKNAKGLHLITQSTPNGQKVQIFLEELADVYGTEWTTTLIDISTNEQKKPWFLRLNPNGRIPVIVDNTQSPPHPVMETSAELLYLLKFDTDHRFGFKDELEQSELIQWLFFWHGSGAPYQGNLGFFRRAKEQSTFAINRFRKETYRVFGVLELQLSGKYTGQPKEYLAGKGAGKYSVADIGTWAWVKNWSASGYTDEEFKEFPHLLKWIERIAGRAAVQRGIGEKYKPS